ncbi:MAG: glucosaminidase domain-containing protein [Alphaproteobacteria bacterium]|nr:glucosaminidase domain-containing protein [Alphaproteobacteria bacterium]
MAYRLTRTWSDPRMQKLADWTREMMDAVGATAVLIGCSREAVIAQAALESAWGARAIGHNIFGIKADASWKGARQTVRTREELPNGDGTFRSVMIDAEFRDYPSFAESVADHFAFLRDNGRYAAAGVFNAGSDQAYFEALQHAGYASDPHYAVSLMKMVESVKLFTVWMVDDAAPGTSAQAPVPPPGYVVTDSGNVMRADIGQSRIVKASDTATKVTVAASAAGVVAAPVAAVAGMSWQMIAALAGLVLAGALAFAIWKLVQIRAARLDMHEKEVV